MAVSNLPSSAPWHTENITEHHRTSQNITEHHRTSQNITAFVNSFLILCFEHIYVTSTSSSAQGGGGSFKDRKTIGEVSDCDLFIYLAS
jgi:UTP:GlnB (protein PII) uridylyltransferase